MAEHPFGSSLQITTTSAMTKRKRRLAGTPDLDAEVVSLSPQTLLDWYVCEICNQGFQRERNLQMHRRRHKMPLKLMKQEAGEAVRKRVFVCPEPSCLHHDPSHALGDLFGIKKDLCHKHRNTASGPATAPPKFTQLTPATEAASPSGS